MSKVLSKEEQLAQLQLMALKGAISEMPEEQRARVKATTDKMRALLLEDLAVGALAFGFLGLEMQLDEAGHMEGMKEGPVAEALAKLIIVQG